MSAVEFGSLFEFIRNGMNIKQDKSGEGLPITRIETIWDGYVDDSRVGYANLKLDHCRQWVLQPGDILLSHINSVEHIGKCAIYQGSPKCLVHGMNLLCLRCNQEKLIPAYARWLLRSSGFRSKLSNFINKAVNQASVSIGNLKQILVQVPDIEEQRRIAAILDKADALRAKRHQGLTKLDALIQSLFLEMFGDPIENERGWNVSRFGQQISSIRYGTGSPPKYEESGIPFIRATNVKNGTVVTEGMKFISKRTAATIEKCRIRHGDLIIVRSGVNAGDCAFVPEEYDGTFAAYDLIVELDTIAAIFYNFFLNSRYGKQLLAPLTRRAAQPHLNSDQVCQLLLISPPRELLVQFSKAIQSMDKIRQTENRSVSYLSGLFLSLQHRAFRGEL